MQKLRLLTAGESHGSALTVILSGLPAGVRLDDGFLKKELARRRKLYGRSSRQKLEQDVFACEGGLRGGITTGNPLAFRIPNAEAAAWEALLSPFCISRTENEGIPRPGHADLAGALKYASEAGGTLSPADIRDVMERASARETACRVLAGAACKALLSSVGVHIASFVYSIGKASLSKRDLLALLHADNPDATALHYAESSPLRMPNAGIFAKAKAEIDAAKKRGTTLGGGFAVMAFGVLPGLGSYAQWDERLDGMIAQAIMSIPAVKEVGIGGANLLGGVDGSAWHDEIARTGDRLAHMSNHAGGITGGVTNGMPVVATASVKPIPTQTHGLRSVDLATGKKALSPSSRADVTAVPAAAVVAESMLALVLADAALAEFGGSHVSAFAARWNDRRKKLESLFV